MTLDIPHSELCSVKTFRSYKHVDVTALREDLKQSLDQFAGTMRVTEALQLFDAKVNKCLDTHALLKTKKVICRRTAEWFDSQIAAERRTRRSLERRWRTQRSKETRVAFVNQRSKFNRLITEKKKQLFATKIAESNKKPHTLFKIVKSVLNRVDKSALPVTDTDAELAQSFQNF